MHTLNTHFDELLKNINPPQKRLDLAKDLPEKVREFLKSNESFETNKPHSRLVGSYAQHTTVGDVKDVDFIVIVPGDPLENIPKAKDLIDDLFQTMKELPEYLGYEADIELIVEEAQRSIYLHFEKEDFDLDVVPCIVPNDVEDVIYVADNNFNEWIQTQPVGLITYLKELNEKNGYKVRPLIKLLKHFRNMQMKTQKPKSYWLLSLVLNNINDEKINMDKSIAEIFHDFCQLMIDSYSVVLNTNDTDTPNIKDPMLGHNISWNWDRSHFETFMRRMIDGEKISNQALNAISKEDAITYWQKLFGEEFFPSDINLVSKGLAREFQPGESSIFNDGRATKENKDTFKVPETKYYG